MSGSMMMLLRRGTVPAGRHMRTLRQYASAAAAGDSTPQPEPEELEIDPALDLPTDPVTNARVHLPVMLKECLESLAVKPGATIADLTLGAAGHGSEIARCCGPTGMLVGVDRDPMILDIARDTLTGHGLHDHCDLFNCTSDRIEAVIRECRLGAEASEAKAMLTQVPSLLRPPSATSNISSGWDEWEETEEEETEEDNTDKPASGPASGGGGEKYPAGRYLDGLMMDLGVSSLQLDTASRGFSFQRDAPLDMRMGGANKPLWTQNSKHSSGGAGAAGAFKDDDVDADDYLMTAAEVLANHNADELEYFFEAFGEERHAKKLAEAICMSRPKLRPKTTFELVEVVHQVKGKGYFARKRAGKGYMARKPTHPATKVFQALRIVVNDELGMLERTLEASLRVIRPGGRLCMLSFHSLEDRIVKQFMRNNSHRLRPLTKRPIKPSEEEVYENPRSRSAKLRAAEVLV